MASALLSQKVCFIMKSILDKTGLCQHSTFADGTCVEVDFSKGTYKITVNG